MYTESIVPTRLPILTVLNCNHCGAHISEQFERVFADEQGRVFACPGCSANAGIAEAARHRAHN